MGADRRTPQDGHVDVVLGRQRLGCAEHRVVLAPVGLETGKQEPQPHRDAPTARAFSLNLPWASNPDFTTRLVRAGTLI